MVPLDPRDLNRFVAAPKRLFGFDRSHVWERYGDMNEYPDVSWIEGPWMLKHEGTYYLQYSASGTQWLTYAAGVYTSKRPTGPFTYAPVNPMLRKTSGVVTGTAHGSIVEGPDGNCGSSTRSSCRTRPAGGGSAWTRWASTSAGTSSSVGRARRRSGARRGGGSGPAGRFGLAAADDQQDARDEREEHVLEPAAGS